MEARTARSYWLEVRREHQLDTAKCERAYNVMLAAQDACLNPLYGILHGLARSSLCLSGGGIRSATFSLGVLHALAKYSFAGNPASTAPRLLAEFDYLSTVSGGGYIGSWFTSWITREGKEAVIRKLAQTPSTKLDPDPKQMQHLRDYSNYLNPRVGLLSADTWTLAATALRNMFLNWVVLIPFVAAALLLPELLDRLLGVTSRTQWTAPLIWVGFGLGALGTGFLMYNLPSFGNGREREPRILLSCILPLALSAIILSAWWWTQAGEQYDISPLAFALFGAGMNAASVVVGIGLSIAFGSPNFRKPQFRWELLLVAFIAAIMTGAMGAWLLSFIMMRFDSISLDYFVSFSVPTVFLTFALVAVLGVGCSSKVTSDDDREWWSRAGAWMLIVGSIWVLMSGLVLVLPGWISHWSAARKFSLSTLSAALGWYATHAAFETKTGPETRGDQSAQRKSGLAAAIEHWVVPVCSLLFLIVLAFGITMTNYWLLDLIHPFEPVLFSRNSSSQCWLPMP